MAPVESKRPNNRIFVGKLSLDVDQNALKEQFSKVGEIVNIKVKKNAKKQIAYAFINFANENSPQEALKYHDTQFNGNQIDVQIAKEVKRTPKRNNKKKNNNNKNNNSNNNNNNNNNGNNNNNDNGNDGRIAGKRPRRAVAKKASHNENKEKELSPTTLFVSNLPFSVDDNDLKDLFKGFSVTSAYTVTRNGRSRGYGFVAFETEEAAKSALEAKNKHQVQDREISVRNAFKYDEPVVQKTNSTDTLYVSNLPYKLADETLQEIFKDYGVAKAYVARTKKGRSKGFGFVVLEGDDLVAKQEKAIAEKNKHKIEEREIYVRAAYNSAESRESERNSNAESDEPEVKQIALYVSNIPFAITSEELGGLFQDNNGFQSANVVVAKKNGRSRGYGFVTFDTEENRDNALESKKDLKSGDRTLSISIARGKKSNNNNNNNNNNRRGPPRRRRFNPRRNGRRNNNNNNNDNEKQ